MKSYFSGLGRAGFKRDREGNSVFYPWGVLGRGRVLPDEQAEQALLGFMSRCYLSAFAIIVGSQLLPDWRWSLGAAGMLLLYWFLGLRSRLVGLPCSDERLGWKESHASMVQATGAWIYWVLLIASVFFCVLGAYGAWVLPPKQGLVGWLLIAVFAPGSLLWIYLLRLKRACS